MRNPTLQAHQVIHIQPLAASKPAVGAPCNGCGLCCLAEPCPLGVLLSRSRVGPCQVLQWNETERQYRCGALGSGARRHGLARLQAFLVGRWIAAGAGCDCNLEPAPALTIGASASPNAGSDHHPTCTPPHD
jgi:hypothetical protein